MTVPWDALILIALGVTVAITLSIDVQLPQRGSVPLGHAVVIAAAAQTDRFPQFAVIAVIAMAVRHLTGDEPSGVARLRETARVGVPLAVAWGMALATRPLLPSRTSDDWAEAALFAALAIGVAYLLADALVSRGGSGAGRSWREGSPVYLSLLCSGALLAMASGWMLVAAALPLAITKFSFERYSAARRTYEQTIQALGIVPELAGHVTLGHGERTAFYAGTLATRLELTPAMVESVVTAARLHHVGHVAVPDFDDAKPAIEDALVAATSAHILRESGFPATIVSLVDQLADHAGSNDEIYHAVVRLASAFDDLVGDDPTRAAGAIAILWSRSDAPMWELAMRTLADALDDDADLVHDAIALGEPLVVAAAAAGQEAAA